MTRRALGAGGFGLLIAIAITGATLTGLGVLGEGPERIHEVRFGEVQYTLPPTPRGYELDISTPAWIGTAGCGSGVEFGLFQGDDLVAYVFVNTGREDYSVDSWSLEQRGPTVDWARRLAATVKVKLKGKMRC